MKRKKINFTFLKIFIFTILIFSNFSKTIENEKKENNFDSSTTKTTEVLINEEEINEDAAPTTSTSTIENKLENIIKSKKKNGKKYF